MIQNKNENYQKAYNELINNLSEANKIEYDKNPTVFYTTFIMWCAKYISATSFNITNFVYYRSYEFKELLKDPIKNFNYVFGNECFTCFNKSTVEKIIKILNNLENWKWNLNLKRLVPKSMVGQIMK